MVHMHRFCLRVVTTLQSRIIRIRLKFLYSMKTETDGQKMLRFSGNRYGENANQFILVIRRMSAQIKKSFYKGVEKMKNFKKPLSLAIAILMIATLFCVPSYADPVSTTSWKNGEMPTVE